MSNQIQFQIFISFVSERYFLNYWADLDFYVKITVRSKIKVQSKAWQNTNK